MGIIFGNQINRLSKSIPIDTVSVVGPTAVFTSPATNKVVITSIELRCDAAVDITDEATIKFTIPTGKVLFAPQKIIGVIKVDDTWTFLSEGYSIVVPTATTVNIVFDNAATGTSQTLLTAVFGYLVI
jgi:hypothetical protein